MISVHGLLVCGPETWDLAPDELRRRLTKEAMVFRTVRGPELGQLS